MLPPVVVSLLAPMLLEPDELVSVEPVPLAPIVLLLEPLFAVSFGLVVELVEAEPAVPADPEVCATAMPPSVIAAAAASAVSVYLVVIIFTP